MVGLVVWYLVLHPRLTGSSEGDTSLGSAFSPDK